MHIALTWYTGKLSASLAAGAATLFETASFVKNQR